MASAVLTITGDATSVNATLRGVQRNAERVAAAINASLRTVDAQMVRETREAAQAMAQSLALVAKAHRDAGAAGERAARRVRAVEDAEGNYRASARRRETTDAEQSADRVARAREQAERRATQASIREAGRRSALDRQRQREAEALARRDARFGQRFAQAGAAAFQVGASLHGQVQSARAQRAGVEHTLDSALFQAGAGAQDAPALRAMVLAHARSTGIDEGSLAAGINAAQTEFSSLGTSRSSQAERARNLRGLLATATFARDTGQDVGEVLRVQGMLAGSGMDATAQRQTLLTLTGMAQRGAIELGSVTRTAMAPMQQRVAQALVGVDPSDQAARAHATQQAVAQTFAEMEVGRSEGLSPRQLGNVTAAMGAALASRNTQARMLTNIRNAGGLSEARRREVEAQLFARDSRGRSVLRGEYQTATGLAAGLTAAGLDPIAAANIFAGGGHGNPMALQANWRRVTGAFMGEGNENVRRMMEGAGHDFTEADVRRGAGLFGGEQQAQLNRDETARRDALTDNTSALTTLSNRLAAFTAANPVATTVAQGAGGLLGGAVMGRVGGAVAGGGRAVLGALTGGAGARGLFSLGGLRALGQVGGAALAGLGVGDVGSRLGVAYENSRRDRAGINRQLDPSSSQPSVFNRATWRELGGAIAEAFGRNPPVVRVDATTLAHAASAAASSGPSRPPEAAR